MFSAFTLWLATITITSFKISGSPLNFFEVAGVFALLNLLVKPILKVIFLPFSLLTLGILSPLANVALLYILVRLVPFIKIAPWKFPGLKYQEFTLPSYNFNYWLTFIIIAVFLTIVYDLLMWLRD